VLLSYRPGLEEPGPEKSFEFSTAAISQRWNAGRLDMEYAAASLPLDGEIKIIRRPSESEKVKAA